MADEACGETTVASGTTHCCTQPADHPGGHRSDFVELDPDNPPGTRTNSHEWHR